MLSLKRNKPSSNKPVAAASLILVLLLASSSLFAQDAAGTADAANTAVKTIGGCLLPLLYNGYRVVSGVIYYNSAAY